MLSTGISGKVLTVINNLYNEAKVCIRLINNQMAELFSCNVGVRQGENLLLLLFSIYLNDLEKFLNEHSKRLKINVMMEGLDLHVHLFVLLYA